MEVFPRPMFILIQMIPFLGVLAVLKFVILDPLLKYILEREEKSAASQGAVRELTARIEAAQHRFEARQAQMRSEASEIRAGFLAEASKQEGEILGAARAASEASVETFRARLEQEIVSARADLDARSATLAGEIATQVLGRPLRGGATEANR